VEGFSFDRRAAYNHIIVARIRDDLRLSRCKRYYDGSLAGHTIFVDYLCRTLVGGLCNSAYCLRIFMFGVWKLSFLLFSEYRVQGSRWSKATLAPCVRALGVWCQIGWLQRKLGITSGGLRLSPGLQKLCSSITIGKNPSNHRTSESSQVRLRHAWSLKKGRRPTLPDLPMVKPSKNSMP
jgi:hypothetical protein